MNIDDLLVPRHPLPRLHEQQVESLRQLPETERAEQAQLRQLLMSNIRPLGFLKQ